MKSFVKEYAKYKKDLISDFMRVSHVDKKGELHKIDRVLELCGRGCISNEEAIRLILEIC